MCRKTWSACSAGGLSGEVKGGDDPVLSQGYRAPFTSPRLRGEADRSEARSGDGDSLHTEFLVTAPHPGPLPARAGRGRSEIGLPDLSRNLHEHRHCSSEISDRYTLVRAMRRG